MRRPDQWTDEEVALLRAMVEHDPPVPWRAIGLRLGRSAPTCNKKWSRLTNRRKPKPYTKILSLSDFHPPRIDHATIDHALEHHGDADICVLNGDVFDQHAASHFPKDHVITMRDEWDAVFPVVKRCADAFPEVHIVHGNHDTRVHKHFRRVIDNPALLFMVQTDPLRLLSDGYCFGADGEFWKAYDWPHVTVRRGSRLCWWLQIGDCVFFHPEKYLGTTPLRTVLWFMQNRFRELDYSALVMGHSHHLGKLIVDGKMLMEQGCCCGPLEYEHKADGRYADGDQGYAVIYQRDGVTDVNRSHFVATGY